LFVFLIAGFRAAALGEGVAEDSLLAGDRGRLSPSNRNLLIFCQIEINSASFGK